MKTTPLTRILAAPLLLLALSAAAHADSTTAPTTCKDGTTSTATGRGACSGHGGVQKASTSGTASSTSGGTAATPPAASAPAPAATTAGAVATTKPAAVAPAAAAPAKPASSTGNTDPTGATAKCKDGTYSKSKHHSGTCSSHGGVDQWLDGSQ